MAVPISTMTPIARSISREDANDEIMNRIDVLDCYVKVLIKVQERLTEPDGVLDQFVRDLQDLKEKMSRLLVFPLDDESNASSLLVRLKCFEMLADKLRENYCKRIEVGIVEVENTTCGKRVTGLL